MKKILIALFVVSGMVSMAQEKYPVLTKLPELVSTKFPFSGDTLRQGYVIAKQMEGLPYYHYGVVYGKTKTSRVVISYGPTGIRVQDIKEFGDGKPVILIKRKKLKIDTDKVLKLSKKIYDPLKNNCEHFVNDITTGEHTSIQAEKTKKLYAATKPMLSRYLKSLAKDTNYVNHGFMIVETLMNYR